MKVIIVKEEQKVSATIQACGNVNVCQGTS